MAGTKVFVLQASRGCLLIGLPETGPVKPCRELGNCTECFSIGADDHRGTFRFVAPVPALPFAGPAMEGCTSGRNHVLHQKLLFGLQSSRLCL